MSKRLTLALAAAAMIGGGPAIATDFTYSSWTPPAAPNNRLGTVPMFERITEELAGTEDAITFQNFMGGQLFNNATTLPAIRDGIVDGGVLVPAYNSAELKTHVTLGETQALVNDGLSGAAAATETLLMNCPGCLSEYAAQNAIPMGSYASTPYYLMCNFEVTGIDALRGKRSAEGNPMFNRWAQRMGMSRQSLSPPDFQQALQRGTVDCVFAPKDWLVAYSLSDVVVSIVDDTSHGAFSAVVLMAMNQDTWGALSEPQREAFRKEMPKAIMDVTNGYYVDEARGMAAAEEEGIILVNLGEEYAQAWSDFQQSERAEIIQAANARGVENAEALVNDFTALLAEWEAIADELDHDPEAIAERMYERIFSKASF
ncbi:C4-dicarboxylate TRAP transporter substrate-binding protein [Martelella radicis]|uniref:TRAP-type C4-dicarboxylate transport system substrate-binding protein n=1 Tax=Martelella radicis TaxID=1397476 RepID=A0A7W6KN75_9HYPH|nr:C4-dicarboxylate TRAP transporter substrate-binding protein [Martelella radicis]MBB4124308.1 TRAP-type C4-dicarboxylate transport system substrate-binding protein [Martelella radicis]